MTPVLQFAREPLTTALGLERSATERADHPAIAALGRPDLTYARLWDAISDTRLALDRAGVQPEEVVALMLPDGPEAILLQLAVADVAACAPLDPSLTGQELLLCLERLKARTLVVAAGRASAAATARQLGVQVVVLKFRTEDPAGVFQLHLDGSAAPPDFGRRLPDAFLTFTSATTGAPKIVPKTVAQAAAAAHYDAKMLGIGPADRLLTVLPLFHVHAQNAVFSQLAAQGTVIAAREFEASAFPRWIETFRPTWYTGGAPLHHAVLAMSAEHPDLFRRHPIRLVRTTGPISEPTLLDRLERELGAVVLNGYGTTESSGVARNSPDARRAGSVGRSLLCELAIMDSEGNLLPPGSEGEVVIRGVTVMTAYLDDPEATQAAFRNGWLVTGDLGRLDADGYLFLSGRIKDFINRGGEKILPGEVDQVLAVHPEVAEVACFGIPHPTLGQDVAAAVVLRPGARVTAGELRRFAAARLAGFKVPREIVMLDELPKTSMGKPKRAELAERYPKLVKPRPSARESGLESSLCEIWESVLGVADVQPEDDFFLLGGDSLSATIMLKRVQEFLMLEQELVHRADFFEHPSVRGLARLLQKPPASSHPHVLVFREKGSRAPLVLFPAHIEGLPFYFRYLVQRLGPEQPVYVVVPCEPVAEGRLRTIQEMASVALHDLRAALPKGPYVIGGHCYGGILAYEAASQLAAQGETVPHLLLFDVPAPGFPQVFVNWRRYVRALRNLPPPAEWSEHIRWLRRSTVRSIGGRVSRMLGRTPAEQAGSGPRSMQMGEYRPPQFPMPIVHFLAADQPVSTRVLDDPRLGWQSWAAGGITLEEVRGDHFSIFDAGNAEALGTAVAEVLTARVSAAGAGYRGRPR